MNILLVILDTARRDAIEPYGAAAGATPAIAQLASRGVAVPHAYSTASWTLPSHASIFTGLLPRQIGLSQAPESTPQSARAVFHGSSERMLGEVMRGAGFAVRGWSTNVWASPHSGLDVGFDSFAYVNSGREERMNGLLGDGRRRAQLAWAMEALRADSDDGAEQVGAELRHSILASTQPHFWFANLCECHSPYLPPRPWNDLPPRERVQAALEVKRYMSFESICRYAIGRLEIPAEAMERMRHLYTRSIGYMDRWLANVLEALDERGILDETLVIVTSDHGENFGEDGYIAHGFNLSQYLTHVPLVMAGPGAGPPAGAFSLAGLPGLIAEAAGIADHPYGDPTVPPGIAVGQCDPMGSAEKLRSTDFARNWAMDETGVERMSSVYTSVTDGATKLVLRNGRELVYDLTADPHEQTPLDPATRGREVSGLRAVLERPGVVESNAAPVDQSTAPAPTDDEVAAIERQMKLLGYM